MIFRGNKAMLSARTRFIKAELIKDAYFETQSEKYFLEEEENEGKTKLVVNVSKENICIANFDKKKRCDFFKDGSTLGMQKCSDHIVFIRNGDSWKICIIEMKTTVDAAKWENNIKPKTRASFLNCLAIAAVLGIPIVESETEVYTTYEHEKFGNGSTPMVNKPKLGERYTDFKKDEWDKHRIPVHIAGDDNNDYADGRIYLKHTACKLERNSDTHQLEGVLVLS